jgi:hypothetical protein
MDHLARIMSSWEGVLNSDAELEERNKSIYSSLEGKTTVQLEIEGMPPYVVEVSNGKFTVHQGSAARPLLKWRLPISLLKEVMCGEHRLIYSILDPRGMLSFDTPNFTHWNGATIIEMLYLACEMAAKNSEISQLVKELEAHKR